MNDRNKQKQLWSDIGFAEKLEKIKAQRLLNGKPVKNIGELTKEMLKCPSFKDVETELLKGDVKLQLRIKMDGKI